MSDSDDNANNLPDGQMENGHVSVDSQFNLSHDSSTGKSNVWVRNKTNLMI